MQQKTPKDYVIATGQAYSVKEFVNMASSYLGMKIFWSGKGLKEVGYLKNKNKKEVIVRIDKNYFRPNEVNYLRGDAKKAFKVLKFKPKYTFESLVKDMIEEDLKLAKKEINFKEIINYCNSYIKSKKDDDILLIEGVGGTMVPINSKYTILDLIKKLNIPIILTIGSYLGSISHTLNSYEVLIKNNVNINSIVLNESNQNNVGMELIKSSLLNYIKTIPIYSLKRNHNNNKVVDKILDNL